MRAYALLLGLLTMLVAPMVADAAPARLDDADLVLVLPATSRREARQMSRVLAPWVQRVKRQYRATHRLFNLEGSARLRMSYVSLSSVVGDGATSPPTAEQLRQYLRSRFTTRPTTTERPRYLGIAALPYGEYIDPTQAVQFPIIPRFRAAVRNVEPQYTETQTDVPYGFLAPETIDSGDGFVDPEDLDMRTATFTVFRIPAAQLDDLRYFADRSNQFAEAPYRSDVALVSGEFGLFPGDTSTIQCINAGQLSELGSVGRIFKVFDYPTCDPDFLVTGPTHRLADFLGDSSTGFAGGMIYDISHGNGDAIYAGSAGLFVNLGIGDPGDLPAGLLNVFVSISCDNDAPLARRNFATDMYLHDSVAVVSATQSVFPTSAGAIIDAEVTAFVALYQSPLTLLQALHRFRAGYYGNYVIGGPLGDRPYNWINLLAVHVLGDGLTIVAQ